MEIIMKNRLLTNSIYRNIITLSYDWKIALTVKVTGGWQYP